jgi:CRP/FNR family cyclic AMP-dependent transcriptional regulator
MSLAAVASSSERIPLLDLDPSLAELLPAERRMALRSSLVVDVRVLDRGELDLCRLQAATPNHIGLLLADGVVSREVLLGDGASAELLGAGDLIRPWDLAAGAELLNADVRWNVVSDRVRAAVLDRRLAAELGACPEVAVALIDRTNARAARIAVMHAITQLRRVDRRLVAMFSHLAERWGRMTAEGVVLPLRLSHRMLGQLIGARRPTVSSALGQLAETGELFRRPDGCWVVRATQPAWTAPRAPRIEPRRPVLVTQRPLAAG